MRDRPCVVSHVLKLCNTSIIQVPLLCLHKLQIFSKFFLDILLWYDLLYLPGSFCDLWSRVGWYQDTHMVNCCVWFNMWNFRKKQSATNKDERVLVYHCIIITRSRLCFQLISWHWFINSGVFAQQLWSVDVDFVRSADLSWLFLIWLSLNLNLLHHIIFADWCIRYVPHHLHQ